MNKLSILLIVICAVLMSCNMKKESPKYVITTIVPIKEGQIESVLKMFIETNPKLVAGQSDWVKASFSKSLQSNSVMVQAYWKNKDSYNKFSESVDFKTTMKGFSQYFKGKPSVEINEILFEM